MTCHQEFIQALFFGFRVVGSVFVGISAAMFYLWMTRRHK